jgi:hypothetical protein
VGSGRRLCRLNMGLTWWQSIHLVTFIGLSALAIYILYETLVLVSAGFSQKAVDPFPYTKTTAVLWPSLFVTDFRWQLSGP